MVQKQFLYSQTIFLFYDKMPDAGCCHDMLYPLDFFAHYFNGKI